MLRNTSLLAGLAVVALAIFGLWLWVWNPTLAKGLALAFAWGLLVYLYLTRLVVPLVQTGRWQYSTLDLLGLVVAFAFLAANRRSLDGLVALGLWPWTVLAFRWRSVDGQGASGIRRTLFWAHSTYFALAMLFSALVLHWLTSQWPIHYQRPLEPPVFVFLLLPAVLMMMTLQQDLAVNFLHPSLVAGIVVSVCTAALVAILTSCVFSILVPQPRQLS